MRGLIPPGRRESGVHFNRPSERLRAELPSLWSRWSVASWFAAPNARLEGHSPADRLDADLEAVVQAARSLGSADALSVPHARRARKVAAHA